MAHTPVDIHQVKQLAATGHFRSIALWLNYPLVPQSIYAQVQTDQYPGYLQVLLEFERPPKQDPLIRLVCNRICRLESDIIRGVYVVGRLIGTDYPLWQQRVKLKRAPSMPSVQTSPKSPSQAAPESSEVKETVADEVPASQPPVEVSEPAADAITAATTYGGATLKSVPSYLIPREANANEGRRRPNRNVAPSPFVQIRVADIDSTQTPAQRRDQRRRYTPKESIEQQFKYMRAIVVTGSAAAAFILGCVTEAIMAQKSQLAQKSKPTLPTFNSGWRPLSDVDVQEIAYRSSMRGPAVSAALEPVAVMPHESSSDPEDPTVTLVFGGEVPVGDVPLQTPDAVGQVLGDLDLFRQADVAMIGLGNSLATADTSLQESYFDRSRPEAVDALRRGGIDIVGLTSEQTMDYGQQGLTETLDSLDSAGIYRVGAGRDLREARRPEVLDVKGQRIAYLSYAPDSDEAATLSKAGLNIQERENIVEDIAALREAVDWIVVNYRWYGDLGLEPTAQQLDLSRSAIDAGADLVVGYHPDQLQGAELYKSRPIVYSLGDFVFQEEPLADHDTATLRVSLREQQMKVEFLPISVKESRPKLAAGETAQSILHHIRQASDTLPLPLQFPTILEAAPHKGPLLKPENPVAPLKTLGELEPETSLPNSEPLDAYGDFDWAPEVDGFGPDPFENFPPRSEGEFNSERFEADGFEPNGTNELWLDESGSELWEHEVEPAVEELSQPTNDQPQPVNSLDTFKTEPDKPLNDWLDPDGINETGEPIQPTSLPKVDNVFDETYQLDSPSLELLPTEEPVDADVQLDFDHATPEQNEDILTPTEKSLPGYDALENWGKKSSPHKEFNPIQERLNSLDQVDELSDSLLPAVSADDESSETAVEAISPHHEPLLGPLS
ncbi:MAG: CapA family protein [Cyanobacteria bacterium P01_F01_bin.116]